MIRIERKIAFIFLPAGGQKPGMGSFLSEYGKEPFAIAGYFLGIDLERICTKYSNVELNYAPYANAATFAQSYSTFELLREKGIHPDVLVGYSVGEYPALCAAGVFHYGKGINYLYENSIKYQKAFKETKYGMALSMGIDIFDLENACRVTRESGYDIFVSNYNAPGYYLIAGEKNGFPRVQAELGGSEGIIMTRVNVPSHTPLCRELELESIDVIDGFFAGAQEPKIPLVSTVTGEFVNGLTDIKSNMRVHLSSPVQWEKSVYTMLDSGINTFIELGPSTGLYKLVAKLSKAKNRNIEVYNTTDGKSFETVLNILGD